MCVSRTLKNLLVVEGSGLHTGAKARVEVHPAPAHRGRVFLRDHVEIPALADYVTDTRRCTTLGCDGVAIHTVEHLLAALSLAGITDAEISVQGPEIPVLDGAAREWMAAIEAAEVRSLGSPAPVMRIREAGWVTEGTSHFFMCPADTLTLYAVITIPETSIELMTAGGVVANAEVCEQMLRARTYGVESEIQALLAAGLARGGSLDNAVVVTRDGYMNDRVWPNEPAWHKVLDLQGDLALVGAALTGVVAARNSGHRSHVILARQLRQQWLASQLEKHQ